MFGLAHGFSSWQECVIGESFLPPWWPEERKKGGQEGEKRMRRSHSNISLKRMSPKNCF